jgi:TatD DNase family protein
MALDVKGLFDSHCHIDYLFRRLSPYPKSFAIFRKKMSAAFPKSFDGCLAIFCDPKSWKQHSLVADSREVVTSFGCHPHHAALMDEATLSDLHSLLTSVPSVVAVGEFGLDYSHRNACDRDVQKSVFSDHVRLAKKLKLPICLHLRETNAYEDGMQLLDEVTFLILCSLSLLA